MAKKKIQKITARTLKSGEVRIYAGGKIADREAKKIYFKQNIDKVDKSQLSKDDARLFSSVKGGVKRSQEAGIFRVNGKFVGEGYKAAAKKIGVDLEKLVEISGEKNLGGLLSKNEGLKDSLDNLLSGVGLAMWHSPQKAMDIITDYKGQAIFVNGQKVSKTQAKALIRKTEQAIFKHFETVDQATKLSFVGAKELRISLPDIDDIEEMSESDFTGENSDTWIIYTSNAKKGK